MFYTQVCIIYVVLTLDWRGGKENAATRNFDRQVFFSFNYWMTIYMYTCFSMTTWYGVNTCVVYITHFTRNHTIRNVLDCVHTDQEPPCFHTLCASQINMLSYVRHNAISYLMCVTDRKPKCTSVMTVFNTKCSGQDSTLRTLHCQLSSYVSKNRHKHRHDMFVLL